MKGSFCACLKNVQTLYSNYLLVCFPSKLHFGGRYIFMEVLQNTKTYSDRFGHF